MTGVDSVGLPDQSGTDEGQRHHLCPGQFGAFQHRRLLLGRSARAEAGKQTLSL